MNGLIATLSELDQTLFLYLNSHHSPYWDAVMALFTGTGFWFLFYLPLLYILIKKYRTKAVVILIILALAITISDQFTGLIKHAVERLRPTHDPGLQSLVHYVVTKGGQYSFFSSHASNTFTVAVFTSLLFKNANYNLVILAWATLVSYTRIYLGLHYPSDIFTGIIFGCLLGFGMFRLLIFMEKNFLLLRLPKLSETGMENRELRYVITILLSMVAMTLLIVNRLQHYNFI